jgi:alkanesulfonate monooxygenase SsuD/methylene tetrahydromethanopterin reductase-like flavin-dependent oxidoreductase (luciferase family)
MTRRSSLRFGLTLSNRGIMTGASTVEDMFRMVAAAEATDVWDSVWVGDSILAKPRVDSICLLSSIAARTERLRLGVACLASAPLRHPVLLAYQWASLDLISGGRTIFVACMGTGTAGGGAFAKEFEVFQVRPEVRAERMEDAVNVLRLASAGPVTYHSDHLHLDNVAIEPRPKQAAVPIWITSNPDLAKPRNVERGLRRAARLGDGWMVGSHTAEGVAELSGELDRYLEEERGAIPPDFVRSLYYNVCLDRDPTKARDEAARFLTAYYGPEFAQAEMRRNVAFGDPATCQQQVRRYIDAGINYILLRLTSYDQIRQFEDVTEHLVMPILKEYA